MIAGKDAIVISLEDAKKLIKAVKGGEEIFASKSYLIKLQKLGVLESFNKLTDIVKDLESEEL